MTWDEIRYILTHLLGPAAFGSAVTLWVRRASRRKEAYFKRRTAEQTTEYYHLMMAQAVIDSESPLCGEVQYNGTLRICTPDGVPHSMIPKPPWLDISDEPFFLCPECGIISYHPDDIIGAYCGRCHKFFDPLLDNAPGALQAARDKLQNLGRN